MVYDPDQNPSPWIVCGVLRHLTHLCVRVQLSCAHAPSWHLSNCEQVSGLLQIAMEVPLLSAADPRYVEAATDRPKDKKEKDKKKKDMKAKDQKDKKK